MKKSKINKVLDKLIEQTKNGEIEWREIPEGFEAQISGASCAVKENVVPGSNHVFSVFCSDAYQPETFRNTKVTDLYEAIIDYRKPDGEWVQNWIDKVLSNDD